MKKIILAFTLLLTFVGTDIFGQRTQYFTHEHQLFQNGIKEMDAAHYSEAAVLFTQFLKEKPTLDDISKAEVLFYLELIQLKNNIPNADSQFIKYLQTTKYNKLASIGNFELANYYFSKAAFEKALIYFKKSNSDLLTHKENAIKNFNIGYCQLMTNAQAKVNITNNKYIPSSYFTKGTFPHGLLAMYNGDYQTALSDFDSIKNEKQYSNILPYLNAEIDYATGRKNEALQAIQTHYKKNNLFNQLAAQYYFDEKNYSKVQTYLSNYITNITTCRNDDYYRLGYAYYQQALIPEAIAQFEKIQRLDNELTQTSLYYLATCYLAIGEKEKAYNTLLECSNLDFDKNISEIVDFNLAKLSYDLQNDEWADERFYYFLKKYPTSSYKEEAIEMQTYLHIKNSRFDDAIRSLDKLDSIPFSLKKVYQKSNYARGIQMLLENNSAKSIEYFNAANRFTIDNETSLLTTFWQAEAFYRLGKYKQSLDATTYYTDNFEKNKFNSYSKNIHTLRCYLFLHLNQLDKLNNEFYILNPTSKADPKSTLGTIKPNYIPDKVPLVNNDPFLFTYYLPEPNYSYTYSPLPLNPLSFSADKIINYSNYVKLGIGNYNAFELETSLDLSSVFKSPLYINYKRNSLQGTIENQEFNQTELGIYSTQKIQQYTLKLQANYQQHTQYYYGYDHSTYNFDKSTIKQQFKNIAVSTIFDPNQKYKNVIKVAPSLQANIYTDSHDSKEISLNASIPFSKNIDPATTAEIAVSTSFNVYNAVGFASQNNSSITITPSLTKLYKGAILKAGIYPAFGQKVHLLPDFSIRYPVVMLNSQLILQINSKLNLNTFKQLTETNPYIYEYYKVHQSKNTEISLGLEGNMSYNTMYKFKTGIMHYTNLPYFLNDTIGDFKQYNVLFSSNVNTLILDYSLDATLHKNVYAGAILKIRPILNKNIANEIWHYVPASLNIYSKASLTKTLTLRGDVIMQYGYSHYSQDNIINSIYPNSSPIGFDLNLSTDLQLNPKWLAYLNIYNLLGSKYQNWYNYANLGTNFRIGLVRSFANFKIKG